MNDRTNLEAVALKVVGTRPIRPDGADKVLGRANFGADLRLPGMLEGRVKRSPHAHARVLGIDTSKARALPGVKAVVTAADFPDLDDIATQLGETATTLRDIGRNVIARDKVLYVGHAVAAVAATSPELAAAAVDLIDVRYEVLPHVIEVEAAMAPDAPVLHDDMFTQGVTPTPTKPSNIAQKHGLSRGDAAAAFADPKQAEVVVQGRYITAPVHQGYIEPHACVAAAGADGQHQIWVSTQGQFAVRTLCANLLGIPLADLRVTPAEIGGGFGGKTTVYLEPIALALSRQCGRPVRMVMSRAEVFESTGPTAGGVMDVKIAAKRDGTITAADVVLKFQAGAFSGAPVNQAGMCCLAAYDIPNVVVVGYDVVLQPSEGHRLSCAGIAAERLCGRECARRAGPQARHGPDRPASEEHRQAGHAVGLRHDVSRHRICRDAQGAQGTPALECTAATEHRAWRGRRLLVQPWRRVLGVGSMFPTTARPPWCRATRTSGARARRWR